MRKLCMTEYEGTINSILKKVKKEISSALKIQRRCDLYIAQLSNISAAEIYIEDIILYKGTIEICHNLFREIVNGLRASDYDLDENFKELVIIRKK